MATGLTEIAFVKAAPGSRGTGLCLVLRRIQLLWLPFLVAFAGDHADRHVQRPGVGHPIKGLIIPLDCAREREQKYCSEQ